MPSRNRIPDDEREAIAEAIRSGRPRNEIAREFKRSAGTITNIAAEFGLTDAFDRSATKSATEAAVADNRARRAIEATESLAVAAQLRDKILTADHGRDAQGWATAYGIMADKHAMFEKHDSGADAEQLGSILGGMFSEMAARHADPKA